jgi:hypothetical protein
MTNTNLRVPLGAAPVNPATVQPATVQPNQNMTQSQGPSQGQQPQIKPPLTPAQMLISHEQRLMEIESAFPDMVGKLTQEMSREFDIIKGTTATADTQGSVELLEKKLDELQATVTRLENSYRLINELTSEMNTSLLKIMNAKQQVVNQEVSVVESVAGANEVESVAEETQEEAVEVSEVNEDNQVVDAPETEQEPTENDTTPVAEEEVVAIKSSKKKGRK